MCIVIIKDTLSAGHPRVLRGGGRRGRPGGRAGDAADLAYATI